MTKAVNGLDLCLMLYKTLQKDPKVYFNMLYCNNSILYKVIVARLL